MPVTKSALKALRRDQRRTTVNKPIKTRAKSALIKARKNPTLKNIQQAYSCLDKAVKKHVFKKGKVNRLKSRLAKLANKSKKSEKKTAPKRRTLKSPSKPKKSSKSKS